MSIAMASPNSVLRTRAGLSLVEVMVSLAIVASLLVAVTAAFNASAQAIEVNDQFFRASQTGRVALNQMLTSIRRCKDCLVGESYDGVSTSVSADQFSFQAADNKYYTYKFNADDSTLTLTDESAAKTYVLARIQRSGNTPIFTADMERDPTTDPSEVIMRPVRITVTFNVERGNNLVRLSGSAVPRRALVY